jgi:two-component system sensor histidine kinase/response regulator
MMTEQSIASPDPCHASHSEVLNMAAAMAMVEGDLQFLQELVQIFLEESPQWLADIRIGIGENKAGAVKVAAHTLRGSAGFFGATRVREAAGRMEEIAAGGDLTAAPPTYRVLEKAIDQLLPALATLAKTSIP